MVVFFCFVCDRYCVDLVRMFILKKTDFVLIMQMKLDLIVLFFCFDS